jgi:hypothetical protein
MYSQSSQTQVVFSLWLVLFSVTTRYSIGNYPVSKRNDHQRYPFNTAASAFNIDEPAAPMTAAQTH